MDQHPIQGGVEIFTVTSCYQSLHATEPGIWNITSLATWLVCKLRQLEVNQKCFSIIKRCNLEVESIGDFLYI